MQGVSSVEDTPYFFALQKRRLLVKKKLVYRFSVVLFAVVLLAAAAAFLWTAFGSPTYKAEATEITAEDAYEWSGNSITGLNDAWLEENGFTGELALTIPAKATAINSSAFRGETNIVSVCFEEDSQLTSIGNNAFYQCSGLTSVCFAANSQLTSIGNNAFYQCSGLTNVYCENNNVGINFPESLTNIGTNAFRDCTKLADDVYLPKGMTTLSDQAFRGCSAITGVWLPEGLTTIGGISASSYGAFYSCRSLMFARVYGNDEGINFPEGLKLIGKGTFSGCSSLEGIVSLPKNMTT